MNTVHEYKQKEKEKTNDVSTTKSTSSLFNTA